MFSNRVGAMMKKFNCELTAKTITLVDEELTKIDGILAKMPLDTIAPILAKTTPEEIKNGLIEVINTPEFSLPRDALATIVLMYRLVTVSADICKAMSPYIIIILSGIH